MNGERQKRWIWKAIVIAGLALVAFYSIGNAVIERQVRKQLSALPPSLSINYASVHANVYKATITLSTVQVQFIPYKSLPQNNYSFQCRKLTIKHIGFLKLLFSKKFEAEIQVDDGRAQLDSFLLDKKDSSQATVLSAIKSPFRAVFISHVSLNNMKYFLRSGRNDQLITSGTIVVNNISVQPGASSPMFSSVDMRLDQVNSSWHGSNLHTGRVLAFGDKKILEVDSVKIRIDNSSKIDASLSSIKISGLDIGKSLAEKKLAADNIDVEKITATNDLYTVHIARGFCRSADHTIEINGISVDPLFGKTEFGKHVGHQADRVQARVNTILISGVDIDSLMYQKLHAQQMKVTECAISIFRDRRLVRQDKAVPLPVEYMRELPIDLRLKSFELKQANVSYEEYPKSGFGETGTLKLENVNVRLTPVINHPGANDPAYMTMTTDAAIMGSGRAHCVVSMPLRKANPYQVTGVIEKLELTKLNSSSENLGKIRIKSGFLDFLTFNFTMTADRSTGKITGAYHQLIIEPLKKHTDKKDVADMASFALRRFIIPLNKDASLPVSKRTGAVNYQRDPTRMVSYYFLQSLLMGVKKSFALGFLLPK